MSERCHAGLCAIASGGDDLQRMCSGMTERITELEAALAERDRRVAGLEEMVRLGAYGDPELIARRKRLLPQRPQDGDGGEG